MYAAYGIASCQSSGASLVVRIFTTLYITLTIRDVLSEFDKPPRPWALHVLQQAQYHA